MASSAAALAGRPRKQKRRRRYAGASVEVSFRKGGDRLEVEVADVLLVEGGEIGLRLQDALVADRDLAELGNIDDRAGLVLDRAVLDAAREIGCEQALIIRAPELERVDRAVLDEAAHLVRRAEADDLDRVGLLGGLDDLRGGRDADGGRRDDAPEVRLVGEEGFRLGR